MKNEYLDKLMKNLAMPDGDDEEEQYPIFDLYDEGYAVPAIHHKGGVDDWSKVELPGGLVLEMVRIEAGTFMMGSAKGSWGVLNENNNLPRKEARISFPFWMSKFVVTNEQYKAVMGSLDSTCKCDMCSSEAKYPAVPRGITYTMGFCQRLNRIFADQLPEGYQFNMPSEIQWEYACKAGTDTPFNNGKEVKNKLFGLFSNAAEIANEVGWVPAGDDNSAKIHPVGQKKPNAWGLYDMHGNVRESVWLRYDYLNSAERLTESRDIGERGGDVRGCLEDCRSADRNNSGRSRHGAIRLALVKKWSVSGEVYDFRIAPKK